MRLPSVIGLYALILAIGAVKMPLAASAQSKAVRATFHGASADPTHPRLIEVSVDGVLGSEEAVLINAVTSPSSWSVVIAGKVGAPQVESVEVMNEGLVNLHLTAGISFSDLSGKHVSVTFAGAPSIGIQAVMLPVKVPDPKKEGKRLFWPIFKPSTDKTNSNLNVSGSLQSGVGATPQYQWDITAKAPVEYNLPTWVFIFGPQFTGKASQKTNADPDSLSASLATNFDFPFNKFFNKSVPISISCDLVDYEFEEKAQQEAVLENGKPTIHQYQQMNSNLIASGQVQFVSGWGGSVEKKRGDLVGLNLDLGTEAGSAESRSIQNLTAKPGYSDNPLRAVAGADLYFDLPKVLKNPFVSVDSHYTVRSPFNPEPFKQAGINNGNEFYSTKARHYIAVNFTRILAKGSNLTVQYRYGSLPPTFSFVDHQVTIGLQVLLGK